MVKSRNVNIADIVSKYDESFIETVSLKDVTSNKELKALVSKLEVANNVVTDFYKMMYNDYIVSINCDSSLCVNTPDIEVIKKYKSIANKIQKAYNYVNYIFMFENPFKMSK